METNKRIQLYILTAFVFLVLPINAAQAKPANSGFKKTTQRWTLEEWLTQKDRNAMMDLWLAMHQSSPYEFSLGASNLSYSKKVDDGVSTNSTSSIYDYKVDTQAYASIFGLGLEYENIPQESFNELTGLFNLRLLGDSIQNTHLTVSLGLRTRNYTLNGSPNKVPQQFTNAELQMYLSKYFGVRGQYRHFVPSTNNSFGEVSGNNTEAGVYIDFGPVRVFGDWFYEREYRKETTTSIETKIDRTGIKSGARFYF